MEAIEKQTNEQEVIAKLNERLGQLKTASEIAVTDQESLVRSAAVKLDLEAYVRAVENAFEPELAPAEERVRRLKINMSSLLQPAKQWLTALVNRQREWASEEKRKAALEKQREQEKINAAARAKADTERREAERLAREQREAREKELEAQRKTGEIGKREEARLAKQAAEDESRAKALAAKQAEETVANAPTVTVQPNIPKVAGVKNQTFYYADVEKSALILFDYDDAIRKGNNERAAFLSRFVMVDEKEVGKFARDTKDPEKVMELLPGVRAWSKG